MKSIYQPPKPSALLFAIRSVGYSFETAVADIIDNSIAANASRIDIYSEPSGEPYFAFLDDGTGMTDRELENALLLGSDRTGRSDSGRELGRYGLGLKSASLSQCRKLSVATKQGKEIRAMVFSLDEIEKQGDWVTLSLSQKETESIPEFRRLSALKSGTLVVWQNFDKLRRNSSTFETSFRALVEAAKRHVEYVFHRFWGRIAIRFNEEPVEKRDPFLLDSVGLQQEGRTLHVAIDGHDISITPFSLPYANALTAEQRKLLGNPKSIYDEQGLYLYRNERLIAWGSWFRTEVRSEMNKLARVRVDIPAALDDVWMLDVKKSSATIPDRIRAKIKIAVNDSTYRSNRAVRKPSEKEELSEHNVWERTAVGKDSVCYSINRNNPLYRELTGKLDAETLPLFNEFVGQVEEYLPKTDLHIDQAQDKKIEVGNRKVGSVSERISRLAAKLADIPDGRDRESVLSRYLAFEAWRDLAPFKVEILKEARNG